ncbi:hypothetical protein B4U80_10311 [Leptotrombidium deliense]|uniref:BTB domain-containing protein n=1 Tax=Leptotrombidium deliense TaxID=299467 RepID=A0A443SPY4_9ACAR|nr:hypothetical protein B4U80_10311 [Leptotrombidium deliense]
MVSSQSSQAFCLKLNSHQTHLIEAFQKLYNDEVMVDCTLSCQGGTLKAHKLVLSACSPYFTNLFSTFTNPYQYPVVILKDMPFSDLKAIIEFMYRGEVTVPQTSLPSVLDSAKTLVVTVCEMSSNVSQSAALCIKLNSHNSDLVQAIHKLYFDESLCDVTVSCGEGTLKAHKLVLSACSNYFKNIFANFTSVSQYPVVIIKEMSFQELKAIIEFMYSGEITVSQASLQSLLNSARMLQIKGLSDIQISAINNSASKFNGSQQENNSSSDVLTVKATKRKRVRRRSKKSGDEESSSSPEQKGEKYRRESEENFESSLSSSEFEDDFRAERKKHNKNVPLLESSSSTVTLKNTPKILASNSPNMALSAVPFALNSLPANNVINRKQWGDDESKALVDSWHSEYTRCKIGGESTLSYKSVCEQLRLQGVDCTPNQVREKVRALKNNYNAIKLGTAKQLVRNHMLPFMEKLQVVLEDTNTTDF